ncbi:MAG: hypothetical protein VYD18_11520 [Candidatus Latescibacterota bacterium]|nr:hypothetical protein [Candidatus Latescibacterota bacterium]
MGLASAWIDRQRLSAGGDWGATTRVVARPETDFVFFSMGNMTAGGVPTRDRHCS